jgi:hypothetical protein
LRDIRLVFNLFAPWKVDSLIVELLTIIDADMLFANIHHKAAPDPAKVGINVGVGE